MNRFEHGGNVYAAAPDGGWLDFSANINPLGLSRMVENAIRDNIKSIVNYPEPTGRELKTALASHYNLAAKNIFLGNGAAELFYILAHLFRPQKVLLPAPSFSEYERAAVAAGAEIDYFPLDRADGFRLDEPMLIAAAPKYDIIFLGNPNNPTGTLLKKSFIEELLRTAPQTLIIVDESFLDFLPDDGDYSARHLVENYKNLIVISSLTKFYAIPGLRLGYGAANAETAAAVERQKDPWNANLLAQKAGVAALADAEYQRATRHFVAGEKDFLAAALKELNINLTVFPPTVNFILLDVAGFCPAGGCGTAAEFAARLREKGILVRDCTNYPLLGDSFIRLAVRSREENEQLLNAIRAIYSKLPQISQNGDSEE